MYAHNSNREAKSVSTENVISLINIDPIGTSANTSNRT